MAYIDRSRAPVIGAAGAIRRLLTEQQLSGRQLAERLGVSPPWVYERMRGFVTITVSDLQRIADALGVPLASLLSDEEGERGGEAA